MTKVRPYLCSLALSAAICWGTSAQALEKVAQAVLLRGEVRVKDKATEEVKVLNQGDWVGEGALLQTAAKSFVKLLFLDKTQMNLGPESKLVINKYPQKEAGLISLIQGKLRSEVSKDVLKKAQGDQDSKLFIKTKSAAMGIRGTDFQVIYNPENLMTSLVTFEGEVAMAQTDPDNPPPANNPAELQQVVTSEAAVLVGEGQFSGANPQQETATIPVKISPSQLEGLKSNQTFQEAAPPPAEGEKSKTFQSPIPPGVTAKAFVNNNVEITKQLEKTIISEVKKEVSTQGTPGTTPGPGPQTGTPTDPSAAPDKGPGLAEAPAASGANKEAPPPEGRYNPVTGAYAPPAGGFIDLKTGLYVPPPPGSTFDPNTGVYVPPPTVGRFDPATGNYLPPAGFKLESDGRFTVDNSAPQGRSESNRNDKVGPKDGQKDGPKEGPKGERPNGDRAGTRGPGRPGSEVAGNKPPLPGTGPLGPGGPLPPPPPSVAMSGAQFIPPDAPVVIDPNTGSMLLPPPPLPPGELPPPPPPQYQDLVNQLEKQRDQNFQDFQNQTQNLPPPNPMTNVNIIINVQ